MARLSAVDGIKPCPFCGHETLFMVKEKDYDANIHDPQEKVVKAQVWFHAVCLKCKTKTGEYSSEQKVIDAWNRRATNG